MKRRGVTILEILVALSLLALTLTFVLNLVPGSLLGLRHSEKRVAARQLARGQLAQEMLARYPSSNGQLELPRQNLNGVEYRIWRTISEGDCAKSKRIAVRVSWLEAGRVSELRQETVRALAD